MAVLQVYQVNNTANFDFGKIHPNTVENQLIISPINDEVYNWTITSINGRIVLDLQQKVGQIF